MEGVKIENIELLTPEERKITEELVKEYYIKIKRKLKNSITLKLYFKEHKKEGKGRKISINAEVTSSTIMFRANAWDWDLARTVHKVMNKILSETEHRFKASEQK
jgi:hypothetical protein